VRYFLLVGHGFNSLNLLAVRSHNKGRRFTPFSIHGSCGNIERVFDEVFLGKNINTSLVDRMMEHPHLPPEILTSSMDIYPSKIIPTHQKVYLLIINYAFLKVPM
jgi:hypothetical protein